MIAPTAKSVVYIPPSSKTIDSIALVSSAPMHTPQMLNDISAMRENVVKMNAGMIVIAMS